MGYTEPVGDIIFKSVAVWIEYLLMLFSYISFKKPILCMKLLNPMSLHFQNPFSYWFCIANNRVMPTFWIFLPYLNNPDQSLILPTFVFVFRKIVYIQTSVWCTLLSSGIFQIVNPAFAPKQNVFQKLVTSLLRDSPHLYCLNRPVAMAGSSLIYILLSLAFVAFNFNLYSPMSFSASVTISHFLYVSYCLSPYTQDVRMPHYFFLQVY